MGGAGGTLIGLAAAMKVMPVLFIPYLAYRGRYRVAASAFGAAAAFSLSPILVFGWGRFCEYVLAWRAALEVGWGVKSTNQSIFAMWDRFIGHGILPLSLSETMLPNSGDSRVMVAVAATLATIVIAALVIFRGPIRQDGWAALSEWSAVFIIGALGGLLTWEALPDRLAIALHVALCRMADARSGCEHAESHRNPLAGVVRLGWSYLPRHCRQDAGRRVLNEFSDHPVGAGAARGNVLVPSAVLLSLCLSGGVGHPQSAMRYDQAEEGSGRG